MRRNIFCTAATKVGKRMNPAISFLCARLYLSVTTCTTSTPKYHSRWQVPRNIFNGLDYDVHGKNVYTPSTANKEFWTVNYYLHSTDGF